MNKHLTVNYRLWLSLFLCTFFNTIASSQSNGTSLRSDITVEHVIEFPKEGFRNEPIRLVKDEVTGNLLYNEYGGTIWEVDITSPTPAFNFRYSAFDHNLPIVQGMTMHDDILYLVGNEEVNNGNDNVGIIVKGVRIDNNRREWTVIARTEPYLGKPETPFDHKMAGNAVSPDGQFIYVSTNSRTNHGEVAGLGREDELNILILKIPTNPSSPIDLRNDKAWLRNNGYLYAGGIRNGFDMAFDKEGNLFEVENSGQRDDPEEMNWIREGRHYGFPYRLGGNDNPIITAGYDSKNDPLVPNEQKGTPLFAYDQNFPAPPAGVTFIEPIRNLGPDADLFRDPTTGAIRDASNEGSFITTFTAHRSPVGFGFDNANIMGGDFTGDAFMASFSGNTWPLIGGDSEDLLHIELNYNGALDNYDANVYKIATGFAQPIDIVVDENIIWLAEYGDGVNRGLWKITLPCGNPSVCGGNPPPPTFSCDNIMVTGGQQQILVSDLPATSVEVTIYNSNNELIFSCNNSCPDTPSLTGLAAGNYRVNVKVFDNNSTLVCEKTNIPAIVTSTPPPTFSCDDITILGGDTQINITGLTAPNEIVQVFDASYTIVFRCEGEDCGTQQIVDNLSAGDYFVSAQFYTAEWALICERNNIMATVTEGTPPPPPTSNCDDIDVSTTNNQIAIKGLSATIEIVQVFDENYTPIFRCEGGDCGSEQFINDLTAGNYIVSVQFYTANWALICEETNVKVTVTGEINPPPPSESADCAALTFTPEAGQISVTGLNTAYSQVQIIGQNTDWQVITICAGDCQATQIIPNLSTGEYTVKVQLNASDGTDCYREEKVTLGGTPPPPPPNGNCEDLNVFVANSQLFIQGLIAPIEIVQIFDKNYQLVFRCQGADCGSEQIINNLSAGNYFVNAQFYTTDWKFICAEENMLVTIDSGNTGIFCDEAKKEDFTRLGNVFAKEFYVSNNSLPIEEAKQACSNANSRLATSLTSEEIDFIRANINNEAFIDLSDANQEGVFKWANDRTYDTPIFDNSETNDLVFIAAWNDELIATNNSVWKHFVCEVPCAVSANSSDSRNTAIPQLENAIKLFPNPAQSIINLQVLPLMDKKGKIQIFNIYGQLVQQFDQLHFNTAHQQLDIPNFENGLYLLTIQADNMPLISKRFVVEHWK